MAKVIMIQGTMSNAGKSLLAAGLCRVFHQDGYRVAPFKSQNMALNSFITREGLEMGRAQVVQAEACGREPSVLMNPILLKPVTDVGSQVIVNGEVRGNMSAAEYFAMKKTLIPDVMKAYEILSADSDVIVIEGAGSPAEINLKADDIVNMGLAKMVRAPVLLVGDIDRGGVFAQLYGTIALLEEEERALIRGTVINKFRGDPEILRPGLKMLEELTGKPVAGIVPYLHVDIEDEDSLSERFNRNGVGQIDIAVPRLPKISNFTDFSAWEATEGVSVRYVSSPRELGEPDLIVLPGTKSTIADLLWMRQNGLESAILKRASAGALVCGICGGYQMLGKRITDACGAEGGGAVDGMGLLPMETVFASEKHRTRVTGTVSADGILAPLDRAAVEGYEIHMGETTLLEGAEPLVTLDSGKKDGCRSGSVFGTYLHGFFDTAASREAMLRLLCSLKGIDPAALTAFDYAAHKEEQYDLLADAVRGGLDMDLIYRILEEGIQDGTEV